MLSITDAAEIRALDLKGKTVKTVAGSGEKGEDRMKGGPALKVGLNSPWDLWLDGDRLLIAMAGHQKPKKPNRLRKSLASASIAQRYFELLRLRERISEVESWRTNR